MIIKILNFILSPWYKKEESSEYYWNKEKTTGYTLNELVSFLWIIPLVILTFGFEVSNNKFKDNCKIIFLLVFYTIIFNLTIWYFVS
jgi:hypothetical protein